MAVALAYFAEHYLIDAIAGWVVVGLSFFAWNRIERELDRRRAMRAEGEHPDAPDGPPDAVADPDSAGPDQGEWTEFDTAEPVHAAGNGSAPVRVEAVSDGGLAPTNPR
jgi:hypothetical protein